MSEKEMLSLILLKLENMENDNKVIKENLDNLKSDLNFLNSELSEIKEDVKVTRCAVNLLAEWADTVSVFTPVKFPIFKK